METKNIQNVHSNPLLDTFWTLLHKQEIIRVRGIKRLLSILSNAQKQYTRRASSAGEQGTVNDSASSLDRYLKFLVRHPEYSPELEYALVRLTRGLGTSDEDARQSFSSALSEVYNYLRLYNYFHYLLYYVLLSSISFIDIKTFQRRYFPSGSCYYNV